MPTHCPWSQGNPATWWSLCAKHAKETSRQEGNTATWRPIFKKAMVKPKTGQESIKRRHLVATS